MKSTEQAVVVLVPGLTCDRTYWHHQAEALSSDYLVTIPRLQNQTSIDGMARLTLDAAVGPLHVVGHSMGGRVALAMYRLAPERIHSLAILDTGVHPASAGEPPKRQVRLDIAESQGMDALADDWIPPMIHPSRTDDEQLVGAIRQMVTSHTLAQYQGQIAALLGRQDERPTLPTISCPTLVACGDSDAWSPPAQHAAIAEAIPKAELQIIQDAGHMVAMERPTATTSLLSNWLQSTARSA